MFAHDHLAISLLIAQPENWGWIAMCGGYVVTAVQFMATIRPFGTLSFCMVLALALVHDANQVLIAPPGTRSFKSPGRRGALSLEPNNPARPG